MKWRLLVVLAAVLAIGLPTVAYAVPPSPPKMVEVAIEAFNEEVVQPIAEAVAQLQGDVDDLEGRVAVLEGLPGGETGAVSGTLVLEMWGLMPDEPPGPGEPPPPAETCFIAVPVDGELLALQGTALSAVSGPDGTFWIEEVPVGTFFTLSWGDRATAQLVGNVRVSAAGEIVDLGYLPHVNPAYECPPDVDGDAVGNLDDNCPFTSNDDQTDTDGDGIGDACEDNDNDGFDDWLEELAGSDPLDAASTPECSYAHADSPCLGISEVMFTCNDGVDNDLDELVDLLDPGCPDLW